MSEACTSVRHDGPMLIPELFFGWGTDASFWPAGLKTAWWIDDPTVGPYGLMRGRYEDGTVVDLIPTLDGVELDWRVLPDRTAVVRLVEVPKPQAERRHPHEPIHLPASGTGVLWCLLAAAACAVFVLCTYLIWSVR